MNIISVYNIKGGVGKTTAAVNFSYLNARDGNKTLICDLDPQASASFLFRIEPMKKQNSKIFISRKKGLMQFVRETDYKNLDLLPSDISFRKLDLRFNNAEQPRRQLWSALKALDRYYDTIFIDCPPNITLLSENIFHASDILLIPLIPTVLSMRTYDQVTSFLSRKNMSIKHVIPFFSMVDTRKNLHKELIEETRKSYSEFLEHYVPYRSEIEKMVTLRAPLPAVHPGSENSREIEMIWREILNRISL